MIKQIKAHLNKSIQTVIGQKVEFIKQDEQACSTKWDIFTFVTFESYIVD